MGFYLTIMSFNIIFNFVKHDYVNRSRTIVDDFEDEELRITVLKAQTRWAIEEATAKNLVSQAKLQKALENLEPYSIEYNKIHSTLENLKINWAELNQLEREASWRPAMRWDEDYEAMENLIVLVQKIRGIN